MPSSSPEPNLWSSIRPHAPVLAAWCAAVLVVVALVLHVVATLAQPGLRWGMADLQVYRAAIDAALARRGVYEGGFTDANLPWLYPPFALIVLAPLGVMPLVAAKVCASLASLAALGVIVQRGWTVSRVGPGWRAPLVLLTMAVLIVSEPMQQNLMMGQVNVVLAALVLTDVLTPSGSRSKGVWIGLAAGIKLTPALVAVYYLVRGDWAAARNAAIAFAFTVALAAVLLPGESWTYWTSALLASRIGPAHLGNQSLLGVLVRVGEVAGVAEGAVRPVRLVLAVALGVGGTWLVARRVSDPLAAYCGMAAVTLLVSPLSWTPHWIALVPVVGWVAARRSSLAATLAVVAGAGLLLFVWPVEGVWSGLVWTVYPAAFWPGVPDPLRQAGRLILGSLYAIVAVVVLIVTVRSGRSGSECRVGPQVGSVVATD